jgi:hypothetical protein
MLRKSFVNPAASELSRSHFARFSAFAIDRHFETRTDSGHRQRPGWVIFDRVALTSSPTISAAMLQAIPAGQRPEPQGSE